ncbi:MAG TPA: HAD family hydrolase, partial [Acidimicrobiales bacterium]|nr:HAD family hydrolase [Acidimicrobiales bacterium]
LHHISPRTRQRVLGALGWDAWVDLALSPTDAGRGRPFPDMILRAVLDLGVTDVAAVAVAGDTWADMAAGRRAGAAVVAGVLTGTDDAPRLRRGGATHVLASVAELPGLFDGSGAR